MNRPATSHEHTDTSGPLRELAFPKRPAKKKPRRHAAHSILQADRDRRRCWLCMQLRHDYSEHAEGTLHKHHVFMGPLRRLSEAEGFYVWLCPEHHTAGRDAVHMNHAVCLKLQRQMQQVYEKSHTRQEFIRLTGRSYI